MASALTRTRGEWIRGAVKLGVFASAVVGVMGGLVTMVVNGLGRKWGVPLPHIPGAVLVDGVVGVGLATVAVYLILMRPKPELDRLGDGSGTRTVGGRLWTGADADAALGGRHAAGAD